MLPYECCTGCSACVSRCPRGALRLAPDGDGFLYPEMNKDRCTHCSACEAVCPVLHASAPCEERACYALRLRDEAALKGVSSGGAASAMGKITLKEGGVVYGVRWTKNFRRAEYARADSFQGIAGFAGTKYIQADKGDIFRCIQGDLNAGRRVLFVGLPCEVAGLKASLRGDAAGLTCVQLVCHGVTSPQYLAQHVDNLETRRKSRVTNLTLREKVDGVNPKYIRADFADGTFHRELLLASGFGCAFVQCSRASCYQCVFKGSRRVADATIGDFWGLSEHPAKSQEGVSLLMTHTAAGDVLANKLRRDSAILMAPAALAQAHAGNPRMDAAAPEPVNRAHRMAMIRQFGLKKGIWWSRTPQDWMKQAFYRLPSAGQRGLLWQYKILQGILGRLLSRSDTEKKYGSQDKVRKVLPPGELSSSAAEMTERVVASCSV